MSEAVLFDGDCSLCNRSVRFVIRRDRAKRFRFASLQNPAVRTWLAAQGHPHPPDSMVLVEEGAIHFRSAAALGIARRLGFPWSWLARLAGMVPEGWRNALYDALARRRIRWFGRVDATCSLEASLPAERVWSPPG
jgi:predicted DCC family thiol-disulfide oxidoreductase YuxK